jgi:hypothetical protein
MPQKTKKQSKQKKHQKGGTKKLKWGPNTRPTNVYGASFSMPMTNRNRNLQNSRKSTPKQLRYTKNTRLAPQNAKVFANLWATYNDPRNMISALEFTNLNDAGKNRVLDHIIYVADEIIKGT